MYLSIVQNVQSIRIDSNHVVRIHSYVSPSQCYRRKNVVGVGYHLDVDFDFGVVVYNAKHLRFRNATLEIPRYLYVVFPSQTQTGH